MYKVCFTDLGKLNLKKVKGLFGFRLKPIFATAPIIDIQDAKKSNMT
jgi:hypothetical protein